MLKKIIDWIDERVQIIEVIENHLTGHMVPANLNLWYSMGSVLLAMLFIQFITGILLLIYYVPDVDKAFESVTYITNEVPFGWLIRRVQAMATNIFIAVLFLHMFSTLFMGSYKKPRELQWMSGSVLFGLGFLAALSGYLLPWSQLSYWATTVATNTVGAVPFVPHFALEDLKVSDFFLGILFIFVFFYPKLYFPPDALSPADPFFTPPHIKPEWYFLANYETLKLVPNKFLGVFIQLVVALLLFFLPLFDIGSERHPLKTPVFLTISILGVLAFIALTVLGEIL